MQHASDAVAGLALRSSIISSCVALRTCVGRRWRMAAAPPLVSAASPMLPGHHHHHHLVTPLNALSPTLASLFAVCHSELLCAAPSRLCCSCRPIQLLRVQHAAAEVVIRPCGPQPGPRACNARVGNSLSKSVSPCIIVCMHEGLSLRASGA